ncbi:hypothetical protein Scep_027475 [Stephania cephalantha]|uniref:Uncharacterized protein n=1 Tax=Stephania cephalantha TaxID=152367 RepID=A0AAP0HHA0_9MAGN
MPSSRGGESPAARRRLPGAAASREEETDARWRSRASGGGGSGTVARTRERGVKELTDGAVDSDAKRRPADSHGMSAAAIARRATVVPRIRRRESSRIAAPGAAR